MKRDFCWLLFSLGRFAIRVPYTLYRAGSLRLNDSGCEYIVWAPYFWHLRFLVNDNFPRSLAIYHGLRQLGCSVTIFTSRNIGTCHGKKIIFFLSDWFDPFRFSNYTAILHFISRELESQGNRVFPSSYEVKFWENKVYMHQIFGERRVRTPTTRIVPLSQAGLDCVDRYPVLVKEEHSCSSMGLHFIRNMSDLEKLLSSASFRRKNRSLILQQWLDIRRDLRVILVGDEIVWYYWRINPDQHWRPTATSYGSRLDFDHFPEKWRGWILDQFRRLELTTGALDIAWQNDDLETEPYILEVSPVYQPNPKPNFPKNLENYGRWKKSLGLLDSYQTAYIDLEFLIQAKLAEALVEKWEG